MRRAPRLINEVQRLGVTVSVAALFIVLLVVFRLIWSATVTIPSDDRLQQGLLAIEDSHQAMLDMDSSLRGYLATGDGFFADTATNAAPALAAADTQMINLLEEPQLREDVLALLLARGVGDADVVHADRVPGAGLGAVADGQVRDLQLGGRRSLGGVDVGLGSVRRHGPNLTGTSDSPVPPARR